MIRGDSTERSVALVFTADEFGEGLAHIISSLRRQRVRAGFFFTGNFYRNEEFKNQIRQLQEERHYLGPHSDRHILYCDWAKRDSLLVTEDSFANDLRDNITAMKKASIQPSGNWFIPPYEWWNDSIAAWSAKRNTKLLSFTPGTRTNADYTWPEAGRNYVSSEAIIANLKAIHQHRPAGLNGSILLLHAGTDPRRTDKLYLRLDEIITWLKQAGYRIERVDRLLD